MEGAMSTISPIIAKYNLMLECQMLVPVPESQDHQYCEYLMACKVSLMAGWQPKP
jgi:hypothetical protein